MGNEKPADTSAIDKEFARPVEGVVFGDKAIVYQGKIYDKGQPITMALGHARIAHQMETFKAKNAAELELKKGIQ